MANPHRMGSRPPQGGGRGSDTDMAALLKPPSEPEVYFVEGTEAIRPQLLDEDAKRVATDMLRAKMKNTQLRRFYSPIVVLRDRAVAGRVGDDDLVAELALLKARAAYAKKRESSTVPDALVTLFTRHAASVRTRKEFIAFARHFEAVVAYHRALSEE